MSTVGQAAGGAIGAIGGFLIGGPQGALYGAQLGLAVGGYLDPPKGPKQQGPRLDDLSVQTATYGAVIPRGYGTFPVTGNIFWVENNKLSETVTENEIGGKGGGSKGVAETSSYSGTFAVGLLDCTDGTPISGIGRIWLANKEFSDPSSTELTAIIATSLAEQFYTVHKGESDQLPDERMQATLGVANTPAYRGLAYIVFKDLPLAQYGNSLVGLQVKVEVIRDGVSPNDDIIEPQVTSIDTPEDYRNTVHTVYIDTENGTIYWFIPRTYMPWQASPPFLVDLYTQPLYGTDKTFITTISLPFGSGQSPGSISLKGDFKGVCYAHNAVGFVFVGIDGTVKKTIPYNVFNRAPESPLVNTNDTLIVVDYESNTFAYCYRQPSVYYSTYIFTIRVRDWDSYLLIGESPWEDHNHVMSYSILGGYLYSHEGINTTSTYRFRKYTYPEMSLLRTETTTITSPLDLTAFAEDAFYTSGNGYTYRIEDYAIVGTINPTFSGYKILIAWAGGSIYTTGLYCSVGLTGPDSLLTISRYYRSQLVGASPPLSAIVSAEALRSGLLTGGDIDVTSLTPLVRGYRISQIASIRASIEQLQGAWPFDVVQSGYLLVFKLRGGSSVATIAASELDARSVEDSPGVSITNSREMDSVLPRRVTINYMDIWRAYDTGSQYAERLNTQAVNVQEINLAIVFDADEAAGIAETLLYLYWLERYDVSLSLPPTRNALEPGDVIVVEADEATYTLRLTEITYNANDTLSCRAKYHSQAVYETAATGETGESNTVTAQPFAIAGQSRYVILDLPTLSESTDAARFSVGMTGYLEEWAGGALFRSDDSGQVWTNLQSFTSPGAIIGGAINAIGAGRTDIIDSSSLLSIGLLGGTLSSVTQLQMLNGANHFAYGADGRWEIIAVQNCVLQGDGTYLLSDMLRGRFGTEWARGLHQAGDSVVLLDSNIVSISTNTSSIGLARAYRGISAGATIDSDSSRQFTYNGVNLECLSPVYLNGNRHPTTNDWTLTWIRRTRKGGEWRDYVDALWGESSLLFDVEIYSSGTYTTLKRTFSNLASETTPYTSAQQVTDFGSNQSTLYVKVYQLSQTVGRGYPLITSITR